MKEDLFPEGMEVWVCCGIQTIPQPPFWYTDETGAKYIRASNSNRDKYDPRPADGRGWFCLHLETAVKLTQAQKEFLVQYAEYIDWEQYLDLEEDVRLV